PLQTFSFDFIYLCSHSFIEVSKYIVTKFISTFLAIPVAYAAGILLSCVSCLSILEIKPFVRECKLVQPLWRTVWRSVIRTVVAGLCQS
uniref:Caveolin n=1 Tax=Sus scrofa TaxID=9823 RepID=A0A8D0TAL9_PIG